jgi:glycosyltransferase involved in cell wall biosynthesis
MAPDVAAGGRVKDSVGFLYAGRLSPEKGLDVLCESARAAGVVLTIVGDGPTRDELIQKYADVADFPGREGREAILDRLSRCRAAVVPSMALENAPLSVLEPMAMGVPVIASEIGGIPEMVRDQQEGLLVPPGDIGALTAALLELDRDPESAFQLGTAAGERARKVYSRAKHMELLLDAYETAIATGS